MADTLEQELQKIYDSEINASISWFWDDGFDVKLGDEYQGYKAKAEFDKVAEGLPWLQQAIAKHYPHSKYNLDRLKERDPKKK